MKITKSRLRKIIKEELTDEDIKFLMNGLQPLFSRMEKNEKDVARVKDAVHDLNKDFKWLNGDVQDLEGSVMTINDKLSIKQPSRFAGPDVVRGTSDSDERTNPRGMPTNEEVREMVEQELEEVYSEKQRRWACAQSGESRKDFKGEPSLSPKEAEEMCRDTKLTKAKKK